VSNKCGLYQKILNVMEAISYLQKDDNVSYGNTNYKAISEEKVTMAVREQLIKNKLIVLPIEQVHTRTDTVVRDKHGNEQIQRLSTVDTKYKIVDVETGEYEILVSSGTGVDTQDKGVGKAMTYAFKYLFLRTFAIPTGEDPDKISSAEWDDRLKGEERKTDHPQKPDSEKKGPPKITAVFRARYKAVFGSEDGIAEFLEQHGEEEASNILAQKLLEKAEKAKKGA